MRVATCFYDKYGTLLAMPDDMVNPKGLPTTSRTNLPVVDSHFSPLVTMDAGYYHRFVNYYPSLEARKEAFYGLLDIMATANTSILEDNSYSFHYNIAEEDFRYCYKNNIPIIKPGRRYVLDVIYVVEEADRVPFCEKPHRIVDYDSVSSSYHNDFVALSLGANPIPYPWEATPDKVYHGLVPYPDKAPVPDYVLDGIHNNIPFWQAKAMHTGTMQYV